MMPPTKLFDVSMSIAWLRIGKDLTVGGPPETRLVGQVGYSGKFGSPSLEVAIRRTQLQTVIVHYA